MWSFVDFFYYEHQQHYGRKLNIGRPHTSHNISV